MRSIGDHREKAGEIDFFAPCSFRQFASRGVKKVNEPKKINKRTERENKKRGRGALVPVLGGSLAPSLWGSCNGGVKMGKNG